MKRIVRIATRVALGIAVVVVVVALVGNRRFAARRDRVYPIAVLKHPIPTDADSIARGGHLTRTLGGCAHCHGDDLGGQELASDAVMHLAAPNLTSGAGSVTRDYDIGDWQLAIEHGVHRDGRPLLVMPSEELRNLSPPDIAAIIAYCRSVPPVDRSLTPASATAFGTVVLGLTNAPVFGAERIDHGEHRTRVVTEPGETKSYGTYLTVMCRGCHGPELRGGIVIRPGAPPSRDISPPAMAAWSYDDFEGALRRGRGRDGRRLDPAMPWDATKGLSDEEMRALWLGLRQD